MDIERVLPNHEKSADNTVFQGKYRLFNKKEDGQSTVEAAFLIPVFFVVLLLLVQPSILLYDRMVMKAAASEACRLLATKTDVAGASSQACEYYIRHRLGAIPQVDCFHVHNDSCSWLIELTGDETSEKVKVSISTQVKPLPLIDIASRAIGAVNEKGNYVISVEEQSSTQPDWVNSLSEGRNPKDWVGGWLS